MNKKKRRSIVWLAIILVLTLFVGFLEVNGMPLWTPYELVPVVGEIKLGLDLEGGMRVIYQADLNEADDKNNALESAMSVLRTRLDSEGYTEATVTKQGTDQIFVEVPGVQDADQLSEVLMSPAKLEFRGGTGDDEEVLLTGDDIKKAEARYSDESGYIVSLEFTSEGKDKFKDATTKYLNDTIYIYLDDDCISYPTVNSVISDGNAIIEGGFTLETVQTLANLIQSGALPIALEEISVESVGATLGAGSLERTLIAGAIAFALILIFMIAVYRLPGLMADLGLVVYMVLMVGALYAFDVTLTLSGIAGIILSVGMAVDANVVIFERIKEELKLGRSARNAVKKGFSNAFTAVLDANITTLIAVIVLAIFGTGTVQGFAVTLGIGIVLSLVTEVGFVNLFLRLMLNMGANKLSYYGVKEDAVNA